ncbi:Nif3-like dinuclear metal center hexameric protein [Bacteroidota bacterium]
MLLDKLLKIIDENLPAESAMEGDRIGLQVQSGRHKVESILITLEMNEDVLKEAIKLNCDCIITFHPLIYSPLTAIKDSDRVGNLCSGLIRNSITLIAVHTNYDAFAEGTSKILADRLGLRVIDFLKPDDNFEDKGMGVVAKPKQPLSEEELLELVHNVCKSPIRYSTYKSNTKIDKIAIVGGSGTSFMNNALTCGAQAFITADITYHRFHEVNRDIMLIDPGHYEMEQFVPEGIARLLSEKLNKSEYKSVMVSQALTNPVNYYPDTDKYIQLQKNYLLNNKMVV